MNTLAIQFPFDRSEAKRWSLSAGFVVAVHATLLTGFLFWYAAPDVPGTASQSIMIDLETVAPTQEPRKIDIAPGPEMQEAPPPAPEPERKVVVEEQIAPTPLQDKPVVVAPPEQKEKPKPVKDKPKPVVERPPKPSDAPAPRTSATPQAAQAARASYNGILSAHLQRFKQYPSASRAASEQGVAMLTFTVSRSGQVLSSRLAKSSGSAALDGETMAMIRRAQPLPSFPPEMTQSSQSFTVPVRFSLR